ncbi:MFS transporter [Kineosporia babensis]|uniref:MFS transporter n=1 Tax=Kineosporia babensis TaxID=499548 RepID=A0A9X1NBQ7_9ACTN|nr:MFS transporter [Kineosporia babensis]MCD5311180.1 MFS transporter [Kineosporia babensis]
MLEVLTNRVFAKLFAAQVIALLGTGLLTVALGLLAYDLAGGDAGVVLATALTIKMLAYVGMAPVMTALAARVPRKAVLVTADMVRAGMALSLPFVTEVGQIYALVFLLQSASATFTPTFQAVIPDVLPDESRYTRALSLSRTAYDLESLISPVLAAALLTVMPGNNLFVGTAAGFAASTLLVLTTRLPTSRTGDGAPFSERLTRGVRAFGRTPELRSLAAMNLVVATSIAMVIVNSVVLVRGDLGRPAGDVAVLLACYGAGSMIVALLLPRVLERQPEHSVLLAGAGLAPVALAGTALCLRAEHFPALLASWFLLGAAGSLILTPSSRLIRRASDEQNRTAVFAAQFSLSHGCFMITYPLAGTLGATIGLSATALVLSGIGTVGAIVAFVVRKPRAQVKPQLIRAH